jgi:hypothetical protein
MGVSPDFSPGKRVFKPLNAPAEIGGFSPSVCILPNADRDFEPARELVFVSAHNLSRAETN